MSHNARRIYPEPRPAPVSADASSSADADARTTEFFKWMWEGSPFVRRAALEAGVVTDSVLKRAFVRLAPQIYVADWVKDDPMVRIRAVAMWAPEGAVIAGAAAALLHGEKWVSSRAVAKSVDIYLPDIRRVPGIARYRRCRSGLPAEQTVTIKGIRCTSVARTAVDLVRWDPDDVDAVVAVDALCNATRTPVAEIEEFAREVTRLHNLARVRELLRLCDHRADSPPETRFRLLLRRSPLPDPELQVRIENRFGVLIATADLGYPDAKVALFYDGGHHLKREQRDFDSDTTAALDEHGWRSMRVTAGMLRAPAERATLLRRIAGLLAAQGVVVEGY